MQADQVDALQRPAEGDKSASCIDTNDLDHSPSSTVDFQHGSHLRLDGSSANVDQRAHRR